MIGEIVLPTDSERANVGPPIVVLIDLWTFLRPRRPPGLWVPDFLFLGGTLRTETCSIQFERRLISLKSYFKIYHCLAYVLTVLVHWKYPYISMTYEVY